MLIVMDVGNTNTVMGIYSGDKLVDRWRLTSAKRTADEIGFTIMGLLNSASINKEDISAAVYASVVPSLDEMFLEGISKYLCVRYLKVSPNLDTGLKIKTDNPSELGADRLLNAIAGISKYGPPFIVVDLGTAITLDVVSAKGEYLGGTIAPGMEVSMELLFSRTAKLPQISLIAPEHYIGDTTVSAIQSGIIYGTVGMVDKLVHGVFAELGRECRVIATGGHARILAEHSDVITDVDQWMTLEGLRVIYERNKHCLKDFSDVR